MSPPPAETRLRDFYRVLYAARGRQHWWPAKTQFEVVLGTYLTQNTAWTNVERALHNLRSAGRLNLDGIRTASLRELEALIRPAGYFRQKARRIRTFVAFLDAHYGGSLQRTFAHPTATLREELLALNGVGRETADSILLYAANLEVFVVDAYTRRILDRHAILAETVGYDEFRTLIERALAPLASEQVPAPAGLSTSPHPPSPMSLAARSPLAQVFNEMHGLLVAVGKDFCRKSHPRCDDCPLRKFLPASP